MTNIRFGTDGWRAVVGKDFNEENVALVTNAIGKYIFDNFGIYKPVIVGYDPRNMAKEYSMLCAEILSGVGFKVYYSDKVLPTPVLAYNARHLDACAIMFTASHNPPEYLGMKFIPDYAGPATAEITDEITANLGKSIVKCVKGKLIYTDFSGNYFKHIRPLIDFQKIKDFAPHIIFDGLYSSSIGYFDKLLSMRGIEYDSIHMYHDPNFGGGMPEPKPQYMSEMINYIKNHEKYVGFANDGDADRFGVVNEKGEYVTPNEIIGILLMHLKKHKKLNGPVVKTVAASLMLDILAEKLGIEVIETPVGFKHVGEAMRKYNPVIAGEESGGLSIQGHIPEKDGILANLLILEAMAYENKSILQLQNELHKFTGCSFINTRVDKRLDNLDEVKPVLEEFSKMDEIAGFKISKKDFKDGVKLYLEDGRTWVLVRPSGTEPLLRIYIESDSQKNIDKISEFVK